MNRKSVLLALLLLIALSSCAPSYVPNPQAIEQRWTQVRGTQNQLQPYLLNRTNIPRLDNIVLKLARASGVRGIQLVLVDNPAFNAAMESYKKTMLLFTGLLKSSDAEIAAVIGHEIGHYVFHDSAEKLKAYQTKENIAKKLYKSSSTKKKAKQRTELSIIAYDLLVANPESRNSEREADSFGIMLMQKAGYPPEAAIRLWFKQYIKGSRGDFNNLISTHPVGGERVLNLMRTVAAYKKAR